MSDEIITKQYASLWNNLVSSTKHTVNLGKKVVWCATFTNGIAEEVMHAATGITSLAINYEAAVYEFLSCMNRSTDDPLVRKMSVYTDTTLFGSMFTPSAQKNRQRDAIKMLLKLGTLEPGDVLTSKTVEVHHNIISLMTASYMDFKAVSRDMAKAICLRMWSLAHNEYVRRFKGRFWIVELLSYAQQFYFPTEGSLLFEVSPHYSNLLEVSCYAPNTFATFMKRVTRLSKLWYDDKVHACIDLVDAYGAVLSYGTRIALTILRYEADVARNKYKRKRTTKTFVDLLYEYCVKSLKKKVDKTYNEQDKVTFVVDTICERLLSGKDRFSNNTLERILGESFTIPMTLTLNMQQWATGKEELDFVNKCFNAVRYNGINNKYFIGKKIEDIILGNLPSSISTRQWLCEIAANKCSIEELPETNGALNTFSAPDFVERYVI